MAQGSTDIHSVFGLLALELEAIDHDGELGKTRLVLNPLITRALKGYSIQIVNNSASTCPNCGVPFVDGRTPYCSERCKEIAAFVRQFRAAVAEGSIFNPEKQAMMGQKLWAVTVGGYPMRQTLVPPKVVAKVIERDGGKCQICGAPATELDHTGSG